MAWISPWWRPAVTRDIGLRGRRTRRRCSRSCRLPGTSDYSTENLASPPGTFANLAHRSGLSLDEDRSWVETESAEDPRESANRRDTLRLLERSNAQVKRHVGSTPHVSDQCLSGL